MKLKSLLLLTILANVGFARPVQLPVTILLSHEKNHKVNETCDLLTKMSFDHTARIITTEYIVHGSCRRTVDPNLQTFKIKNTEGNFGPFGTFHHAVEITSGNSDTLQILDKRMVITNNLESEVVVTKTTSDGKVDTLYSVSENISYSPLSVESAGSELFGDVERAELKYNKDQKYVVFSLHTKFECPEGMVCAAVMPQPQIELLPVLEVLPNRCGGEQVKAVRDDRPFDGNLYSLTFNIVRDFACGANPKFSVSGVLSETTAGMFHHPITESLKFKGKLFTQE